VMLRLTMPPRHSRMCSSMIDMVLSCYPSVVTANWNSTAHSRSGASATIVGGPVEVVVAFTSLPLRYSHGFLAPKPLDPLVIQCPPLGAGVMICGTESTTRMVLGVGAQPIPQCRVWIGWRCLGGFVTWGGRCCPVTRRGTAR
jgi:hypothetical protein